ncbi:hypothetical protein [Natronorubrum sp. DTA28]
MRWRALATFPSSARDVGDAARGMSERERGATRRGEANGQRP